MTACIGASHRCCAHLHSLCYRVFLGVLNVDSQIRSRLRRNLPQQLAQSLSTGTRMRTWLSVSPQGAPQVQYFSKGASSGAKIFSVINRKPDIDADCTGLEPEQVEGSLKLENVSFAYPARPDVMVMKGFSLDVPAGKPFPCDLDC